MVFQMPMESFDPRCTLGDGIGESLRNMGISRTETRRKVEELLERCGLEKEYAIILFQIVFLFYNSYISKANVPTTIRSSPVPDFNDSFSWNTIYENAMVTRILSLSIGTTTLAGPV